MLVVDKRPVVSAAWNSSVPRTISFKRSTNARCSLMASFEYPTMSVNRTCAISSWICFLNFGRHVCATYGRATALSHFYAPCVETKCEIGRPDLLRAQPAPRSKGSIAPTFLTRRAISIAKH
jgi:hypothetical protein